MIYGLLNKTSSTQHMSSNDELIKKIKKELRTVCNVRTAIKIKVTETNDEPNVKGYRAVKPAWRRRGKWQSYSPSSRRIEVGLGSAILLPYVVGNEQLQKELLALYDSNNL